ncbi:type VI secretion system-associated protein TagF [Aquisalimonas lutea]|uniref:type VI secretion system-associated protein TagF n=1 Tax=Aquisalimonas lutea TaxID=1327750 RepID=UPI0025B616F7|nr:type VI secretion system-associated protein TagF [Aquisalimonas lutea]MDN3519589.1 type VI secretion system-associated protein TagF [Aquisalimonas lutea]
MTASEQQLCGLFGKVPQQPDFVHLHLPEVFVETWHSWAQAGLSITREQLGDHWLELYLTSPAWRFALAPQVCGPDAVMGVLIPSVDEVGRYFPLCLAVTGLYPVWSAYLHAADWYRQAETVAMAALREDCGYMALVEQLEALPLPELPAAPDYSTRPPSHGLDRGWVIGADADMSGNDRALALLDQAYNRWLGAYSLWWTAGSERVAPCLLVSPGLPEAGQTAAMLDGDWEHWGWGEEQRCEEAAEP